MTYYLNKILFFFVNPLSVGLFLILIALALHRWRKIACGCLIGAFAWLWFWSMPLSCRWTGLALESTWFDADGRVPTAESAPEADAIVVLGGGMGANADHSPYAEIFAAGDRAWHAARLYRAGKAPRIILSGTGSRASTLPFLVDLGVPTSAILIDDTSKNTEENAKFTADILAKAIPNGPHRTLLVTSAFHMKRSLLMFHKYAPSLTLYPAPTDFEVLASYPELKASLFFPDSAALARNVFHIKEFVGYWGYRLLR